MNKGVGVLFIGGFLGVALFIIWIYCVFDVIAADESLIRNLPKFYWLLIVILIPSVGAVAWLALGRPLGVGLVPGSTDYPGARRRPRTGPIGPEDEPGFISALEERGRREQKRLEAWEEELRRREEDLKRRELGE